ncbi:hypothetical protein ACFSQJ_04315 [Croceitalea marina]|uniref:Uncharacterized protein n=1 Tax=Croceitalea marina TaxID=1775166 RepID=A0ABW5MSJ9_9FLAO
MHKTQIRKIILTLLLLIAANCLIAQSTQNEVFDEFKSLYKELKSFKDNNGFKKYGFATGGPYHIWLKKVRNLKSNPNSKLLIKRGFVVGELEALGLEYVTSKGRETEITIFFNKIFIEAISAKN